MIFKSLPVKDVGILASHDDSENLDSAKKNSSPLKYRKIGKIGFKCPSKKSQGLPLLESDQQIEECLQSNSIDIVCLDLDLGCTYVQKWANMCASNRKKIFVKVPKGPQSESLQQHFWNWQLKRFCDWLAALLILTLLSPLMVVLAILVKISSPGPIFFRQWRVGKRGQLFQIIKFRTMIAEADQQHHAVMGQQNGLHKLHRDPRVTPIGFWMRKYSLDELPQLLNVLTGEMSLVGPRPWALYDAVQLQPKDQRRLRALPGITGLWQVKHRSQLLDIDVVTKIDLLYLRDWSIYKDLKILLMTIPSVVTGRGAF